MRGRAAAQAYHFIEIIMSESNKRIHVAITLGDVNGIGCEVVLKALTDQHITEICTPVIYGSGKVLAFYRKMLNVQNFNSVQIRETDDIVERKVNIVSCMPEDLKVEPGQSSDAAGKAAVKSLEAAVTALKEGRVDVVVTAPVNKHTMQGPDFAFPGQTEFFQQAFGAEESLMFMVGPTLKIGTVTGHMPLKDVPAAVTEERIIAKLEVMQRSLQQDFTVLRPKIAVLALNPHAGEDGLLGDEESRIIAPAIAAAYAKGIAAFGPFPADGFFASDQFLHFDAVLAMYHDQAMLPFKVMNYAAGVNFTAGLPVVRTSPAHGTAYGLAGKDEASCQSFKDALYAACDIYRRRTAHAACAAHALKDTHAPKKAMEEKDTQQTQNQ